MFKFLFVLFFFFILLVFLMGFSLLRTFRNILFGNGSARAKKEEQRRQTNNSHASSRPQGSRDCNDDGTTASPRKKIFAKDEGEYVDYEEVK